MKAYYICLFIVCTSLFCCQTNSEFQPVSTEVDELVDLSSEKDFIEILSFFSELNTDIKNLSSAKKRLNQIEKYQKIPSEKSSDLKVLAEGMGYDDSNSLSLRLARITYLANNLKKKYPDISNDLKKTEKAALIALQKDKKDVVIMLMAPPEGSGNCRGIYDAKLTVNAVAGAAGIIACGASGPASPVCIGLVVAGTAAANNLAYQEYVGCMEDDKK